MRINTLRQWTAIAIGLASVNIGVAHAADRTLDKQAMATLRQCQQLSSSCADTTQNAAGVLVFPNVIKADLIVGGSGGKGALIENGKITGYYDIGAASAGLQAGIDKASQVYVFRTADGINQLKSGQDWKVGANAGVTLVTADANAQAASGNILAYVFKSEGLEAGIALNIFDVWKDGKGRPSQS